MKNEMPKIPNSNHKLLKKGTKLVLSAATFGVVAAGSFQGVNYVVDNYNKQKYNGSKYKCCEDFKFDYIHNK